MVKGENEHERMNSLQAAYYYHYNNESLSVSLCVSHNSALDIQCSLAK